MNEGRKCVLASGSFTYDWPSCRRGGVLLHQQREAGGAHRLRQDGRGQRQLVAHAALAEKPAAVFALFLRPQEGIRLLTHGADGGLGDVHVRLVLLILMMRPGQAGAQTGFVLSSGQQLLVQPPD